MGIPITVSTNVIASLPDVIGHDQLSLSDCGTQCCRLVELADHGATRSWLGPAVVVMIWQKTAIAHQSKVSISAAVNICCLTSSWCVSKSKWMTIVVPPTKKLLVAKINQCMLLRCRPPHLLSCMHGCFQKPEHGNVNLDQGSKSQIGRPQWSMISETMLVLWNDKLIIQLCIFQ